MAICWESAVPLAFHLLCFISVQFLLYVSLSHLVFGAGCGIRLVRFLIIAFLSTLYLNTLTFRVNARLTIRLFGVNFTNLLRIYVTSFFHFYVI